MPAAPHRPDSPNGTPVGRTLAEFARQLASEEAGLEPVSYEEIESYVDGRGDVGSRALFVERLESDPALAAVVTDLAAFRAELEAEIESEIETARPARRILPFRRPEQPSEVRRRETRHAGARRIALGAAAAAALLAAVLVGPSPRRQATIAQSPEPGLSARPALTSGTVADQPVFADGFEAGSAAAWTSASGSARRSAPFSGG